MEEIWRDVKGFEGLYQVSNLGNVKSVEREIISEKRTNQKWTERKLKPCDNGRGYLVVHLRNNGKRYVRYVHRLVIESFVGEIGDNDINHKDFNRKNNCLNNLEILTRKENINYSKNAGKYNELYQKRFLKTKERYDNLKDKMLEDIKNGISIREIEKKYKVNHKTLKKYGYI